MLGFHAFIVAGMALALAAGPEGKGIYDKVVEQIKLNDDLITRTKKTFETETEITAEAVPAAYSKLRKEIEVRIQDSVSLAFDSNKSLEAWRKSLFELDAGDRTETSWLKKLYAGKKESEATLKDHDLVDRATRKALDELIAKASSQEVRVSLIEAGAIEQKKRDRLRGAILSSIRLVEDLIGDRLKELGPTAKNYHEKISALEEKLVLLKSQVEASEGGLSAYRQKLNNIFFGRNKNGSLPNH